MKLHGEGGVSSFLKNHCTNLKICNHTFRKEKGYNIVLFSCIYLNCFLDFFIQVQRSIFIKKNMLFPKLIWVLNLVCTDFSICWVLMTLNKFKIIVKKKVLSHYFVSIHEKRIKPLQLGHFIFYSSIHFL